LKPVLAETADGIIIIDWSIESMSRNTSVRT